MTKNHAELKRDAYDFLSSSKNGVASDVHAIIAGLAPDYANRLLCELASEGCAVERNGLFFKAGNIMYIEDNTYAVVSQKALERLSRKEAVERRHKEALNYILQHPGTTTKEYAAAKSIPHATAGTYFYVLRVRNEAIRRKGRYFHASHINFAPSQEKPVEVKRKVKKPRAANTSNEKSRIADGKMLRIRNYLGSGRRTTLRDLMNRFDITEEDIVYMKSAGVLKSRSPKTE